MTQAERARSEGGTALPVAPLISCDSDDCMGCWSCARHCPAGAIRILDGSAQLLEERCVKCGVCVTDCGRSGFRVRDDLSRVRQLLSSKRPVVAMLASEYIAAMHPLSPEDVESRLLSIGFTAVESTVLGEELVATAYERLHGNSESLLPSLRSTCVVAVSYVRTFYPHLTQALAPIQPPYVVHARLIREVYPDDVALVYVSPCWARKDEVFEESTAGAIDAAIGFDELKLLINETGDPVTDESVEGRIRAIKEISVTDGFPRRTLTDRNLANEDVVVVRGLDEIDELLSAISRGETAPRVVDMLNCDGCIDGPCVNRDLSVYVKRQIDIGERKRQPPAVIDSRTLLGALPPVSLHRSFKPNKVAEERPTAEEVDQVLLDAEFDSPEKLLDCGACGYRTCRDHAAAVWAARSTWEVCIPVHTRRLERERDLLNEAAATDALTGLVNRRELDHRLNQEVARARRYGEQLSVVMMDIDRFKDINDSHGHASGDAMLRAVGVLLKSELRAADIAGRFGGDEFVLVLPNTGKTDAWAVAEKMRAALAQLNLPQVSEPIRTTASLGVASLSESLSHPDELLDAADKALYRAKRAGRNRVELAPG